MVKVCLKIHNYPIIRMEGVHRILLYDNKEGRMQVHPWDAQDLGNFCFLYITVSFYHMYDM
jgi:hypothetical protein